MSSGIGETRATALKRVSEKWVPGMGFPEHWDPQGALLCAQSEMIQARPGSDHSNLTEAILIALI